jgi:iron complex transport system ATP-binding protein
MSTVVELRSVEFVRNANRILSGVSWRIERGQHTAILGANGSGKTSLLKIVTGYEWPTEGDVWVLGRHFGECDIREMRKHIGWVSSSLEHQLPGNDTVMEVAISGFDASIGLYREATPVERAAALQELTHLGIERLAERPYRLLSQGEQQRVLIARALVCRPALLILDEPCAGLDPAAREHFLADLGHLARRTDAPTLTLVTHHIDEIRDWIAQVLILKSGRILAHGPARETLRSEVVSNAFDHPFVVESLNDRYYLRVNEKPVAC